MSHHHHHHCNRWMHREGGGRKYSKNVPHRLKTFFIISHAFSCQLPILKCRSSRGSCCDDYISFFLPFFPYWMDNHFTGNRSGKIGVEVSKCSRFFFLICLMLRQEQVSCDIDIAVMAGNSLHSWSQPPEAAAFDESSLVSPWNVMLALHLRV